jgi:GT2 family glycosyltransferase
VHPPPAHLLVQLIAWLIALPWIATLLDAAVGLPKVPDLLTPEHDQPSRSTLTVIVPARNEAAAIRACLQSLIEQDLPDLHILAVDDRSTDATGDLMDSLAAAHPDRLRVLHVTELPPGWLGKTHAMALAARTTLATHAPDFILFTDGDILFAPFILRRALAQAETVHADHFIVLPTTLTHTPGESMLLAFLQSLSLFAVQPWRTDTPGERGALGVGAFNLIRTSAYLQLGGFDALRTEIVEDLALGRRVKASGLRQRCAYAPGAVSVHWAPGLIGVLHGMTKNLFAVFRFRPVFLLAGAVGLAAFVITPWLLLTLPATRLPAALAIGSLAGIYTLVSRRSLISPLWFVTAPVAAALLIYSMLRSMLITLHTGGVTWRGTFYPLATLKSHSTHKP